jgi:hypothetical protein
MFLRSSNNVFWVAVLFIMAFSPFGLFYYRSNEWIIPLTSTVGVSFKNIIGLVFFIKWIALLRFKKQKIFDFLFSYYLVFFVFILFLIFVGFFFGFSLVQVYNHIQFLIPFLLFLVVPTLFNQKELLTFNKILFLFSVIHTIVAFADILSSGSVISFLVFYKQTATASVFKDEIIRLTGGIFIAFYSMVVGLYYIVTSSKDFKSWYLWFVVLLSWLFILSSATRGWMIASFFLIISYLIFYTKKTILSARTMVTTMLLVAFGYLVLPAGVINNLGAAFTRFETVESVAEGDLTAGGTAERWVVRGPRVLTLFNESPIFGFGYSKITYQYYDGHVGNHTLLLIGGVVGLLVVWLTVIAIVIKLFTLEKYGNVKGVFVFGITMLSVMIIHSTSRNMVSFLMPADSAFFICILLNHVNIAIREGRIKALAPQQTGK